MCQYIKLWPSFFIIRGIHAAFNAQHLEKISTIPIPPSIIPIIVFLFILSFVTHKKLKIVLFSSAPKFSSGNGRKDATNLLIPNVFIISVLPKIASFLFFHDSKSFSLFHFYRPSCFYNTRLCLCQSVLQDTITVEVFIFIPFFFTVLLLSTGQYTFCFIYI